MIGVGIDVIEVDRLRQALTRTPSLANRLFTDNEIRYSERFADPMMRLSARFAGKEAVMKALGVGLGEARFKEIEISNEVSGAPSVSLSGDAAARSEQLGISKLSISLSHTNQIAQAIAVAE